MKFLSIIPMLFLFLSVQAQKRGVFNSTTDVANYINAHDKSIDGKILSAYQWVTRNIQYNTDRAMAINHGIDTRARIDVAFERRKGVCENFAAIFSDICQKLGFESVVINGYTKMSGSVNRQGHSWSAVQIKDNWYLFDPTWDAGKTGDFKFFKLTGAEFIGTHIPFDPIWQMLEHPLNYQQFEAGRINSQKTIFNYKDSIVAFLASESLTRYAGVVSRIAKGGVHNRLTNTHLKIAKGDLEIQKEEQQMAWFNQATELLNQATHQLNTFINYRNNQFLPELPNPEIRKMLEGIREKIDTAFQNFDHVDASDAVLVYGTDSAREQAEKLRKSLQLQQNFLVKYLTTATADRKSIFYQ